MDAGGRGEEITPLEPALLRDARRERPREAARIVEDRVGRPAAAREGARRVAARTARGATPRTAASTPRAACRGRGRRCLPLGQRGPRGVLSAQGRVLGRHTGARRGQRRCTWPCAQRTAGPGDGTHARFAARTFPCPRLTRGARGGAAACGTLWARARLLQAFAHRRARTALSQVSWSTGAPPGPPRPPLPGRSAACGVIPAALGGGQGAER